MYIYVPLLIPHPLATDLQHCCTNLCQGVPSHSLPTRASPSLSSGLAQRWALSALTQEHRDHQLDSPASDTSSRRDICNISTNR